jgi:hypothetical protein
MSDAFALTGGYTVTPLGNPTSFAQNVEAVIDEAVTLAHRADADVRLLVNTPVVVSFGGVTNAHVVILKALGGKVDAIITTADGAAQVVPFDTYFILMCNAKPVTALSLTRTADTDTTVRVFLGEQA